MTRPAASPRRGNRWNTPTMTAREAQTMVGCIRKLNNLSIQMRDRGVSHVASDRIDAAIVKLIQSLKVGNRLDELNIPRRFL